MEQNGQNRDPAVPCCGDPPAHRLRDGAGATPHTLGRIDAPWCGSTIETVAGAVPRARTTLGFHDRLSTITARCGLRRMGYRVPPRLYAVGTPGAGSPVMLSANYKLSFDHLRSALDGRDAWILVLDTKGINVWCAAGKGTFGTDEVVRRVEACGLGRIVSHHRLVVPQLGATGVSAHRVYGRCGFHVVFGPVRARDLPAFLDAGMKAEPEMRRVRFDLRDRVTLIPVELVNGAKYFILGAAALLLLSGLSRHGYSLSGIREAGLFDAALVLGVFAASTILGPMLLPWLPGRAFAVKGASLGIVMIGALAASGWLAPGLGSSVSWFHAAAWALIVPAIASFTLMNFTGSTTFTSLSGVLREMRIAVPAQIAGGVIGFGLWVTGLFLGGGR